MTGARPNGQTSATYPLSLAGHVALVVGDMGGIGAAACAMLVASGADVVLTHRETTGGAAAASALVDAIGPSKAEAVPADVADTASLLRLRNRVTALHGRLDILVNAAGFTQPMPHHDLDALTDELIDSMFQVNLRGQFACIRTFAPLLRASGNGLVVSVSSIAGSTGVGSSIAYCAAKAGIDIMTKSLTRALAPAIRVLAVSPGVVDTGFVPVRSAGFNEKVSASTPLKRIATPDDVASAIVACATMLGFSTGHTILVDGGRAL